MDAGSSIAVRVRLFAMQRDSPHEAPDADTPAGRQVEDAWAALVAQVPALAPGRDTVRFAVDGDYADASVTLHDGAELACIPPVSSGERHAHRHAPDPGAREEPLGADILDELGRPLATDGDGAIVRFIGRAPFTPGTPAQGQEAEAARRVGSRGRDAQAYEAHGEMALKVLWSIADEVQ